MLRMSDYDESFDDSFDSASDSDHVDGGAGDEGIVPDSRRTMMYSQPALEPVAMKDFLILHGGNGARDSLSDQDDFRYVRISY